jgi:hypothetical protein
VFNQQNIIVTQADTGHLFPAKGVANENTPLKQGDALVMLISFNV